MMLKIFPKENSKIHVPKKGETEVKKRKVLLKTMVVYYVYDNVKTLVSYDRQDWQRHDI